MITGHLPAGYIFGMVFIKKVKHARITQWKVLTSCLLGSIAPDLDMFYFYLVDNRQHHHHTYWSHWPIVWIGGIILCFIWYRSSSRNLAALLAILFTVSGFLHLMLDTIVGDIWWLLPFLNEPFALFNVPALFNPWWLNFIIHWSFGIEIFLWLFALFLWKKSI